MHSRYGLLMADVHPNDAARRILDVVRASYEKNGGRRNFGFSGEESDFDATGLTVEQRRLGVRVLADHGFVKPHGTRNVMLEEHGVEIMLDPDAMASALPVPRVARPLPRPPARQKVNEGAAKFVMGETGMVRVLELLRRCDAHEGRQRFHVPCSSEHAKSSESATGSIWRTSTTRRWRTSVEAR